MQETKMSSTFAESVKGKLSTLFLHCVFTKPEFIKGEISKHLELPHEKVILNHEKTINDKNGEELYNIFKLNVYDIDLALRFDKRIESPKIIKVPKVVNKPKKWYQSEPETMVVIEEKQAKQTYHWTLNSIEY